MEYEVILKKHQHQDKWSGGKTTQLGIFPKNADVKKKDFIWRLSTATCKKDKAKFTDYTGFNRVLIPLEGEVKLEHKPADGAEGEAAEIRQTELGEMEQVEFSGAEKTTAYGLKRDYNLIIREDAEYYVDVIDQILAGAGENADKSVPVGENGEASFLPINAILEGKRVPVRLRHKKGFDHITQALYCADGFSSVHIEEKQVELVTKEEDAPTDIKIIRLTEGDQLILRYREGEKLKMNIKGAGRLIHCQMFYNV